MAGHPELLDWLAREFVDSGWNVKALMKRIVLSATYPSGLRGIAGIDRARPGKPAAGARSAFPPAGGNSSRPGAADLRAAEEPARRAERVSRISRRICTRESWWRPIIPGRRYVESKGDDLYRRSLYTFWKRTVPHPTMTVFDAPDREFCVVRRSTTNTPLQALTLLNDPIFVEAARKLAERSIHEGGSDAGRASGVRVPAGDRAGAGRGRAEDLRRQA